jgi:hypothetical protein
LWAGREEVKGKWGHVLRGGQQQSKQQLTKSHYSLRIVRKMALKKGTMAAVDGGDNTTQTTY